MDTFEKVKEIIRRSMPDIELDGVTKDSSVTADLGLDSLSTMMIAIMIEDEFNMRFKGDIQFETVGELCNYIDAAVNT